MVVSVTAVSICGVDDGWVEQPNLVIPHKCFLIDAVHGCKLADCEKPVILIHVHLIKI